MKREDLPPFNDFFYSVMEEIDRVYYQYFPEEKEEFTRPNFSIFFEDRAYSLCKEIWQEFVEDAVDENEEDDN